MKKAVVVPSKGSTVSYAVRNVIELINECGDKGRDIILETDQEAVIKFFVDDVYVNRTGAPNRQGVRAEGEQRVKRDCGVGGAVRGPFSLGCASSSAT